MMKYSEKKILQNKNGHLMEEKEKCKKRESLLVERKSGELWVRLITIRSGKAGLLLYPSRYSLTFAEE